MRSSCRHSCTAQARARGGPADHARPVDARRAVPGGRHGQQGRGHVLHQVRRRLRAGGEAPLGVQPRADARRDAQPRVRVPRAAEHEDPVRGGSALPSAASRSIAPARTHPPVERARPARPGRPPPRFPGPRPRRNRAGGPLPPGGTPARSKASPPATSRAPWRGARASGRAGWSRSVRLFRQKRVPAESA